MQGNNADLINMFNQGNVDEGEGTSLMAAYIGLLSD